jgi:DNA-binding CsgD family transcriptional regulator
VREHMLGRFQAARQSWETAYAMAIRGGDTSASSLHIGFTSVLARETGDFDEHRQILSDMAVNPAQLPPILATLLVLVKVEEGSLEDARVEYERLRPLYPTMERGARWIIAVAFFGELAAIFGDQEVASSTHEALLPFAGLFNASGAGGVLCTAPIVYYVGLLEASLKRPDEARVHLRSAIDLSYRAGAPGFAARAQHTLALITRPNDPAGASSLAGAAAVTAKVLGMRPLYERATALVAELAPAAEAATPLSPREREVAALLARGLSNRLIAETLVLSPRTVESHVQSILMKLGFTSRAQAAAWAVANGLTGT